MCPQVYQVAEIARPAYYDRQPVPAICAYSAQIAPAASTIRATYTPSGNGAAFFETFFLYTYKGVAAAPAGLVQLYVEFLPFFGGTYRVQQIQSTDNTIFAPYTQQSNSFGYMAYGDVIRVVTFDGSTGGAQAYGAILKGTEFIY